MAGLHTWGNETRERLRLEKMGDEVERLGEKAQTVQHHGLDCVASGHNPHCRVVLGGSLNACRDAQCFKHPRDQTHVIEDLGAVRLWLWWDGRAVRVAYRF